MSEETPLEMDRRDALKVSTAAVLASGGLPGIAEKLAGPAARAVGSALKGLSVLERGVLLLLNNLQGHYPPEYEALPDGGSGLMEIQTRMLLLRASLLESDGDKEQNRPLTEVLDEASRAFGEMKKRCDNGALTEAYRASHRSHMRSLADRIGNLSPHVLEALREYRNHLPPPRRRKRRASEKDRGSSADEALPRHEEEEELVAAARSGNWERLCEDSVVAYGRMARASEFGDTGEEPFAERVMRRGRTLLPRS